jgi:hypothetical protein
MNQKSSLREAPHFVSRVLTANSLDDLLSRSSTGVPKEHRPLLIGLGNGPRSGSRSTSKMVGGRHVLSRRTRTRPASALSPTKNAYCHDASLLAWQEEAAAIIRDAKHRHRSGSDELALGVLEEVARSYLRHARRQR